MSDRTTYLENNWLNQIANGIPYIFPPEMYVALLFAVTSSEAGTFNEITLGGYLRRTGTFGAPTDGIISSSANITFPQATAEYDGQVTHFALMDSGSGGEALYIAPVGTGGPVTFVAADDDLFTTPSSSFANGQQTEIKGQANNPLPVGISLDTPYFIISASGDNYRLAATVGGVPIDVGSGAGWIRRVVPRTILTDDQATFLSGSLQIIAT